MGRLVEKTVAGVRVMGYTVAGEESVCIAPEHDVAFDVGRAPREIISINNVCLTHGHMDHAAGVAYYLSQRGFVDLPPGRVIVHRGIAQAIQRLMDVWGDIERHPTPGTIVGVEHLEEVEIRRGLFVRAFTVNHSADSLGFSLIERRHKLKAEFTGLDGPQLVALKKKGVAIEENTEVVLLTYTGDTALGRFLDLDFVRKSRALLIECTFYDREHVSRARAGRHLHAEDFPKVLAAAPEAEVVVTHVTRRTDMRVVRQVMKEVVPRADMDRVSFFMDRPPRVERAPTDAAMAGKPEPRRNS